MLKLFITNIQKSNLFLCIDLLSRKLAKFTSSRRTCMCVHSIGIYTYRMIPSVNKRFCLFLFHLHAFNLGAFFQWLDSSLINKETIFISMARINGMLLLSC